MRSVITFCLAAVVGVLAIVAVSSIAPGGELFRFWYWVVATPLLCLGAAALGYWFPKRAWLWGVAPLFGQWLWHYIGFPETGSGNLGPFAHIVVFIEYALTAVLTIAAAVAGTRLSPRRVAS